MTYLRTLFNQDFITIIRYRNGTVNMKLQVWICTLPAQPTPITGHPPLQPLRRLRRPDKATTPVKVKMDNNSVIQVAQKKGD